MDDWEQEYEENPEPIIKSEAEVKSIIERKLVEDSDNALTDSLFGVTAKPILKPIVIIPTPKIIQKRKPIVEKDKDTVNQNRLRKQEKIRHEEIFGHGELDEIEEKYYNFEDKYR